MTTSQDELGLGELKPVGWFIAPDGHGTYQQVAQQHNGEPDLIPLYGPDAITTLIAERDGLREALTPSGATKAAYIGEFSFGVTLTAGDEEEYRRIQVPWTTIKEIMAAISERAALSLDTKEGK